MVDLPDWNGLVFRHYPTDHIFVAAGDTLDDPPWTAGELRPADEPLSWRAAAATLSYGCGIIEGLKAERTTDGRILLFRTSDHGERFARSAARMMLLPYPTASFVDAVEQVVRANLRFVPPAGMGTFYIRPMEHAVTQMLGLGTGHRFAVTIYGSPVGILGRNNTSGDDSGLRLKVLRFGRAAPGGTGAAKAIGNYAGTLMHKQGAQAEGFDDVLYLDAAGAGVLQETAGANVFCLLRSGVLVTPALDDTILAGITRDSVIALATRAGIEVQQRALPLEEVLADGQELFCSGTAWTVRSVAQLGVDGRTHRFSAAPEVGPQLRDELHGIKAGTRPDPFGWTTEVEGAV